ncbi:SH3 domain-containing protein [Muricoccus vinaceus]|uniref:SH3 domain-containing protein n=1 Tax=Muricoccus vinaceus TaxID=424704 RepID=A0ABV6IWY2_9PROT
MRHWLLAGLLLFGGCESKAAERPADRRAAAQRAAEDTIREVSHDPVAFRAVVAFQQATPRVVAVCGQVRIGPAPGSFTPFVAVVTYWDDVNEGGTVTPMLATTGEGATRVTIEAANRCREGGGAPAGGVNPPSPARDDEILRRQETPQGRPATPSAPETGPSPPAERPGPGSARQGDTVTSRLPGTLRSSPDGRGAAIGVLRAGTGVTVYGTAPGGWYEVGDASGPTGWVHGSRLFGTP